LPLAVIALLAEAPNLLAYWSFTERQELAHKGERRSRLPQLVRRARGLKQMLLPRG
jgi:hypothetical protein